MAFDNANVVGRLYGLHYTEIKIDIPGQIMLTPIYSSGKMRLKEYVDAVADMNLKPVDMWIAGPAEVSAKGVTIHGTTIPWPANKKATLPVGKMDVKIKLSVTWDKLGANIDNLHITEAKKIDWKKGYRKAKAGGGFTTQ
jgi:hypothetical protein